MPQVKHARTKLGADGYGRLHREILRRDGWRCQSCGAGQQLEVHHLKFRSQLGDDAEENLITLNAAEAMPLVQAEALTEKGRHYTAACPSGYISLLPSRNGTDDGEGGCAKA